MATEVVMPQMGESIAEGTITKWLKQVGDKVERDEPLFEISTDKVDSVIPAPAAGVLLKIDVPEGQTVEINTTVGLIGEQGEAGDGGGGGGGAAATAEAQPSTTQGKAEARPTPEAGPPQPGPGPQPAAPAQPEPARAASAA